jgi:hypothetical protein
MEPIVIATGLATALCVVFLIYGAWLCISEARSAEKENEVSDTEAAEQVE